MYENLDTVGILNQSKIDEYKNSKGTSNDIEYLENIVSSDDNSYINSFVGINEFNTVYRNSTSNDIPQPVTEIRQEFITEDIIKSFSAGQFKSKVGYTSASSKQESE